MREADFQRRVTDMATRFGWKWWHVPAPMRRVGKEQWVGAKEGAGIADLILTHDDPPTLVFMELKGDDGKLSDAQQQFLKATRDVADHIQALVSAKYGPGVEPVATAPAQFKPVGIYAFWPRDEADIEQLLRYKVLT